MNTDKKVKSACRPRVEKCVICGQVITDVLDRNNPWPVRQTGNCCGFCNMVEVIPARLRAAKANNHPNESNMIITCSGNRGYHYGNYDYWLCPKLNRWVGVHTDVHGDADGKVFYGKNKDSILKTIKLFAQLGEKNERAEEKAGPD